MSEHTPTPYCLDHGKGWTWVSAVTGTPIADCSVPGLSTHEICEANAAFIVRACNSHTDLLAACKALVAMYATVAPYGDSLIVASARAAIAKAERAAP